jgi:hypothetical protein
MNNGIVISTDGACSGRRAACAAVLTFGGRVVAEKSRTVPHVQGYALAAEIAGVALAAALIERAGADERPLVVEVDNPLVPRVLRGEYRPPGFRRIPRRLRESAEALCWHQSVRFSVLRRNSTPGLRRAHRLASARLWGKRRARKGRR